MKKVASDIDTERRSGSLSNGTTNGKDQAKVIRMGVKSTRKGATSSKTDNVTSSSRVSSSLARQKRNNVQAKRVPNSTGDTEIDQRGKTKRQKSGGLEKFRHLRPVPPEALSSEDEGEEEESSEEDETTNVELSNVPAEPPKPAGVREAGKRGNPTNKSTASYDEKLEDAQRATLLRRAAEKKKAAAEEKEAMLLAEGRSTKAKKSGPQRQTASLQLLLENGGSKSSSNCSSNRSSPELVSYSGAELNPSTTKSDTQGVAGAAAPNDGKKRRQARVKG